MNVRCPNCQTVFRVDPARVPEAGVRARCSRCRATFTISRDGGPRAGAEVPEPAAAAAATGAAAPDKPSLTSAPAEAEPTVAPTAAPAAASAPAPQAAEAPPAAPQAPQAAPAPIRPAAPAAAAAPPVPPAAATATGRTPIFGSRDPSARAQRIARALVSDIVAYHPKRRDECLEAGTLRTAFREEIMKSWEEYVAQVGLDMARSTPFFRDALNDVLAKGQRIF